MNALSSRTLTSIPRLNKGEETFLPPTFSSIPREAHLFQHRKTKRFKQEKTFFKQENVLYMIGALLPPGHYSYPFNFQLPGGLPGIFFDERREWDNDKVKGAIIYKAKVFLDVPGKDLKKSEKIVISEALCRTPQALHDHKEKGFMFAKGKLRMDYWLAKNVFSPGEPVQVKLRIENDSSKTVKAIKVKLMRDLKIKSEGYVKHITEEISKDTWAGVPEKSTTENVFNFAINPNVFPTTHGSLVECDYHLDIECDVPMAIDLEHHVPIVLVLMPTAPMPISLYATYTPHAW